MLLIIMADKEKKSFLRLIYLYKLLHRHGSTSKYEILFFSNETKSEDYENKSRYQLAKIKLWISDKTV